MNDFDFDFDQKFKDLNKHLKSATKSHENKLKGLPKNLQLLMDSYESIETSCDVVIHFLKERVPPEVLTRKSRAINEILFLIDLSFQNNKDILSEDVKENLSFFYQKYRFIKNEERTNSGLEKLAEKYRENRDYKKLIMIINLMSDSVNRAESGAFNYLESKFASSFLWIEIDHLIKSLKNFLQKEKKNFSFIIKGQKGFGKRKAKRVLLKEVRDFLKTLGPLSRDYLEVLNNKKFIKFDKPGSGGMAISHFKNKSKLITPEIQTLDDQLFLIHELTHAVHFNLNMDKNSSEYHPRLVIAEMMSILFEMLFLSYRISSSKEEELEVKKLELSVFIFRSIIDNARDAYFESSIFKIGESREITRKDLKFYFKKSLKDFYIPKNYDPQGIMWSDYHELFDPFLRATYFMASIGALNILELILTHKIDFHKIKKEMERGKHTGFSDLFDFESFLERPEIFFKTALTGYLSRRGDEE